MCLAFSHDGAFMAAQGGGPEWNLAVWQWEKSKLSGVVKGVTQARPCRKSGIGSCRERSDQAPAERNPHYMSPIPHVATQKVPG